MEAMSSGFPSPKLTKTGKGTRVGRGPGTLTPLAKLAMEASRAEALATDRVTGSALLTLTNSLATRSMEAGGAGWRRIQVRPSQRLQKPLVFPEWAKDQIQELREALSCVSHLASFPPSSYMLQHASHSSHGKVEASEGASRGAHLHLSCVTLSRHFQSQSLVIPSLSMSNA